MGSPLMVAEFFGLAGGWRTPPRVPKILRRHGYDPDLYVCNQTARLGVMTVDSNPAWRPVVVADMNALPFRDGSFRCGFLDPPYDVPYKRAVVELARVCRERIAILHVRDVGPPGNFRNAERAARERRNVWRREASILGLCGNDSLVRVLNLFQRAE